MFATEEQIEDLLEIQALSLKKSQVEKEFKDLPQRQAILQIRTKRQEIQAKATQVAALLEKASKDVNVLANEDAQLAARQQQAQEKIASGEEGFRAVETLSKELDSLSRQREELSRKNDEACAQLEKAQGVNAQILAALEALDSKEKAQIASFQQQGGALQKQIADLEGQIKALFEGLGAELAQAYKKVAERGNGVGIGKIVDGRCGCCRSVIDAAHMQSLRAQAPLGTCPSCKRLLAL